jgi:hypothetical protein
MMLLLGLTCLNIKNVFAWYNTPVKSKTLYMGDEPVAKMGTTTQYGYIGPSGDRDPRFYSALITDGCVTMGFLWFPQLVEVEVSGTDPNGDPLSGDQFVALSVLSSPDDSGVEQQILQIVYDYLVYKIPPGLRAIVKNTISAGGATTGRDSQKAWGVWQRAPFGSCSEERGLRFGYELSVDPTLEGTYTINIHYHSWICNICADNIVRHAGYIDLYDTVTYEYVNTPNTPSTPSGPTSGYRWKYYTFTTSTTDPNCDMVRYQFDWGDGSTTWTSYKASGATASASNSWNNIGSYLIRVRAQDSTGVCSGWSPYKKMNIIKEPGNPCPTLFGWNGSEYVEEGVLDIHGDSDVTFLQGIEQTLVPEHRLYKLSLRELDEFTSHIDYVKLYAVDNNVKKYKCHLVQAVHNELGHVEGLLLLDDGSRVDLNPLQTIDLKFTAPNTNEIAYFIFEINGYNIKP